MEPFLQEEILREDAFDAWLTEKEVGNRCDDGDSEKIEDESFFDHLLHGEFAGAENDRVGHGGNRKHEGATCAHSSRKHEEDRIDLCSYRRSPENRHEDIGGGSIAGHFCQKCDDKRDDTEESKQRERIQTGKDTRDGGTEPRVLEGGAQAETGSDEDQQPPGDLVGGLPVEEAISAPRTIGENEEENDGYKGDRGIIGTREYGESDCQPPKGSERVIHARAVKRKTTNV